MLVVSPLDAQKGYGGSFDIESRKLCSARRADPCILRRRCAAVRAVPRQTQAVSPVNPMGPTALDVTRREADIPRHARMGQ